MTTQQLLLRTMLLLRVIEHQDKVIAIQKEIIRSDENIRKIKAKLRALKRNRK